MTTFAAPASDYMTAPVLTVGADTSFEELARAFNAGAVSAVGVTDADGKIIGVVSRTDVLRASREGARSVRELMSSEPVTVAHDTTLAAIAKTFLRRRIHRVFVERDGATEGVVSTLDLARAVMDKREKTPAIEFASRSTIRIGAEEPVKLAIERLDVANKHGLIVVDGDWPVGTFAQREALAASEGAGGSRVEEWMNQRVLSLPPNIPAHRVAAQALALGVRRVILISDYKIEGVVSTFDFARIVA